MRTSKLTWLRRPPMLMALVALLPACAAYKSTSVTEYSPKKHDKVGLWYKLPKALFTIEGKQAKDSPLGYELTLTKKIVADSRHTFHLGWSKNALFDDKTTNPVTVNEDGLLTNVEMNTSDQTANIITDLLDSAVNVFKAMGGGPQSGTVKENAAKMQPFSFTFDPLDTSEREIVRAKLEALGVKVAFCPTATGLKSCLTGGGLVGGAKAVVADDLTAVAELEADGVLFHPPTVLEMRFAVDDLNLITRETMTVPNVDVVACFPFKRAPLVNSTTSLTLNKGTPSGFKIDRPSPVKGFTAFLKSATGIVASAIPTSVNVDINKEKSELAAEKSLLEAQTNQLKAEKALADQIRANGGAQSAVVPPSNLKTDTKADDKTPAEGAGPGTGPQSATTGEGKQLKFQGTVDLPK